MKLTLFPLILFMFGITSASAEEPIIGLITLPEVLGNGPCDNFAPEDISVYSEMDSELTSGVIKVDSFWTFPDVGGCEGLTVNIHMKGDIKPRGLLTEEYSYEASAAIVLDSRKNWYKLKTHDVPVWIHGTKKSQYYPLEYLLSNNMVYIKPDVGIRLYYQPGGVDVVSQISSSDSIQITNKKRIDSQLWLHIQVMSSSDCESIAIAKVLSEGWIPAHAPSGELTTWFYSRGC